MYTFIFPQTLVFENAMNTGPSFEKKKKSPLLVHYHFSTEVESA